MSAGDLPLDPATLAAAFGPFRDATTILVAVSGGPDSVALLGTLARWSHELGVVRVVAATVDHALRAGSREEAEGVSSFCAELAIDHTILTWRRTGPDAAPEPHGGEPRAIGQAKMREARYALLAEEAGRVRADHVALAHHRDDQAETLLMRMAAGTGLAGLGGMRPRTQLGGALLVRPFLHLPKTRLVATCRKEGWPFVTDPSNASLRFARARWRALAPALAAEGLHAARLGRLAARLARADAALVVASERAFTATRLASVDGQVALDGRRLLEEPDEIALRVIGLALEAVGGTGPALRLERLEACHAALAVASRDGRALRRTLGGRVLSLGADGRLHLVVEDNRRRGRGAALTLPATELPPSLGMEPRDT